MIVKTKCLPVLVLEKSQVCDEMTNSGAGSGISQLLRQGHYSMKISVSVSIL